MKRIGVREFRDHATRYLAGDEVLAIERHGQPIGFVIPAGRHRRAAAGEAVERLEQIVQRVRVETGLSEDELSWLFDLNEPVPERPNARTSEPGAAHASRR